MEPLAILVAIGVLLLTGWLLYPSTKLRRDANSAEKMQIGFVVGMMNGGKSPESAGQAAGAAVVLIERFEKMYGRKPTSQDKALIIGMMAGANAANTGTAPGVGSN